MFNTNLQPGSTGPEVQKLQEYLVSNGYMTQDQMNTGPGIYGPRTTAAVKSLQEKLKVDNSSGPGYFGPRTRAALGAGTPPAPTPTPTLPPAGGTPPTDPTLPPDTGGNTTPLLTFANSVDAAVNLARQHRNAKQLDIMKPLQGTVAASDFNAILGNFNAASDSTSEDLIKRAVGSNNPSDIALVTNDSGDVSGIDRTTGSVVWTAPGVGNRDNNSTGTTKDQGNDIAAAILDFQNQMKTKGWRGANPDAYEYYKAQLIKAYGAAAALQLDKAMEAAKIYIDNGPGKPFGPDGGSFSMNSGGTTTPSIPKAEGGGLLTQLSSKVGDLFKTPVAHAQGTEPTYVPPPTVSLQLGSNGQQVKQLQDFLKQQGYLDNLDEDYGSYGYSTKNAVAEMQKAGGIDTAGNSGVYGPKTMKAIQDTFANARTRPAVDESNPFGISAPQGGRVQGAPTNNQQGDAEALKQFTQIANTLSTTKDFVQEGKAALDAGSDVMKKLGTLSEALKKDPASAAAKAAQDAMLYAISYKMIDNSVSNQVMSVPEKAIVTKLLVDAQSSGDTSKLKQFMASVLDRTAHGVSSTAQPLPSPGGPPGSAMLGPGQHIVPGPGSGPNWEVQ